MSAPECATTTQAPAGRDAAANALVGVFLDNAETGNGTANSTLVAEICRRIRQRS